MEDEGVVFSIPVYAVVHDASESIHDKCADTDHDMQLVDDLYSVVDKTRKVNSPDDLYAVVDLSKKAKFRQRVAQSTSSEDPETSLDSTSQDGCSCSHASMIGKISEMADSNISLKKSKTSGERRTILLLTLLLAFSLPLVTVLIIIGTVLASLNEINCSS